VAELLSRDTETSGSDTCSAFSVTLRRYACMTLTNLTYADSTNKSLLCAMPVVLRALVSQLRSTEEDLRQVTMLHFQCFHANRLLSVVFIGNVIFVIITYYIIACAPGLLGK